MVHTTTCKPCPLKYEAISGRGALLILFGKDRRTELGFDPLQHVDGLAFGVQRFTSMTVIVSIFTDWYFLIFFSNGSEPQHGPIMARLGKQAATWIVMMKALHSNNSGAILLIIPPGKSEPNQFIHALPRDVRIGICGVQWIIENKRIAAETGQASINRSSPTTSAFGRGHFIFGIAGKLSVWKHSFIPRCVHDLAQNRLKAWMRDPSYEK